MLIDSGIKDRITAAASALYEEAGRSAFPTVAAVRARAGSDMNAASLVMREWRRAQTVQAAPVVVEVPGKVQAAHNAALAVLWAEAQALANERLLSAQTAWDAERVEAEALRAELSDAFEGQRGELEATEAARDAATDEVEELKTALAGSHAAQQAQAVEVAQVRERLTLTEQAARDAAAHHIAELERLTTTNKKMETMQAQIAQLMRSLTPAISTPAQPAESKPTRSKATK